MACCSWALTGRCAVRWASLGAWKVCRQEGAQVGWEVSGPVSSCGPVVTVVGGVKHAALLLLPGSELVAAVLLLPAGTVLR
jgi:hypothetical protein